MWYIHNYSAMNENEMLSFVAKWIKLEDVIVHEISQAQKDKYIFSLKHRNLKS
jgi:hypothetical protein